MSGKGSGGLGSTSSGDVILANSVGVKPKGLIDAISEVEWYATAEKSGSPIPERFFTLRNKFEFFEVGFKGSFISGLISAILTPFAIGVIEKMIPVFGSSEPSLFDQIFVFSLALGFSLGYAIFIGSIGRFYVGKFTKTMIKNLLSGVIAGAVLKAFIAFLFFHFLYLVVLKDERIVSFLQFLLNTKVFNYETFNNIYLWIKEFKPIFLTSAWFVVITTIIFISTPLITITVTVVREKRKQAGKIV